MAGRGLTEPFPSSTNGDAGLKKLSTDRPALYVPIIDYIHSLEPCMCRLDIYPQGSVATVLTSHITRFWQRRGNGRNASSPRKSAGVRKKRTAHSGLP